MSSPRSRRSAHRRFAFLSAAVLVGSSVIGVAGPSPAHAATPGGAADAGLLDASAIAPQPGPHGYFVDAWATNSDDFQGPEANAAHGVLSGMLDIWTPGAEWNTGTKVDAAIADSNIGQAVAISTGASDAEQERAYVIDRRHQNYTASEGLGVYTEAFRAATNSATTIPDEVPAAASTTKFDDESNENGAWADVDSELGAPVALVDAIRNHSASSNPSKNYYRYPRPFRWSDAVDVPAYAQPLQKPEADAASDGGFPSGHTNAGHMATNGLAYAFPQQSDELYLKAAEIGTSRIELGMHSPLDVMGGRLLSTATTAGALNDPALAETKDAALAQGQAWLEQQEAAGLVEDALTGEEYDAALAEYTDYMTFGFPQSGDGSAPVHVPKGAEVLLETRLPYLDDEQRRWVLHSTALESGYPINDDAEGWGRINLFAAANGYGTLTLSGDNAYTGGTVLAEGALVLGTPTALGAGDVENLGGTLRTDLYAGVAVAGDFVQDAAGTLELSVSTDAPALTVSGTAALDGTLALTVPAGTDLAEPLTVLEADALTGAFADLEISGLAEGVDAELVADGGTLQLVNAEAPAGDATTAPETPTGEATTAPEATAAPEESAGGATEAEDAVAGGAAGASDGDADPAATTAEATDGAEARGASAGALPRTGAQVGMLVGAGALLLALGAGALAVARRRG
ncbi:phosphatase PAP2 family protein [Brevibacterium samyangense]|uniref:Phosphatidic acid phosphatase type 2/haloperoxidase domain-containing protein n=1 Tax=Brevibacterium samyangense TaxID=366888 RepID=A0ABN2TG46_9MICO